jgi:hypothetical protein
MTQEQAMHVDDPFLRCPPTPRPPRDRGTPPAPARPALRPGLLALCALAVAGCGGPGGYGAGSTSPPPAIQSFAAGADSVLVGGRTQLTAVFSGDGATIDGIGAVQSGVAVTTPALARATTFTLTVRRGPQRVEGRVTVAARYRDRLRALAPSAVARTQHLAVALAGGGALAMGGNTSETPNVPDSDTSQRFDPAAEAFTPGPPLAFTAQAHFTTPAPLDGGAFLLVGGGVNSSSTLGRAAAVAAQAFDPGAGRFGRTGDLIDDHSAGGSATALGDGGVLVAGGQVPAFRGAERYDPASGLWGPTGDLVVARRGHTATRLADGRVLIAGGITCCDATGEQVSGAAELYDPRSGRFQPTGSLGTARALHAATLLPDGRVLVTGGIVEARGSTTASAELYDPSTGRFEPGGAMQAGRELHSAVLLTDGRVLALGGLRASALTDLFEPASGRWLPGPALEPAWGSSTATMLESGKVLVFGGEDAGGFPEPTALLYE